MFIATSLKCAVLLALFGSPDPKRGAPDFSALPTPQQLHAEITGRQLKGFREALAVAEDLRKYYQQQTDGDYSQRIAELLKDEAEFKRRIEALERGQLTPVPRMPTGPPQKPKVRD